MSREYVPSSGQETTSYPTKNYQNIGRRAAQLSLAMGLLLPGGAIAVPTEAEAAVGCFGDYCSGKSPMDTGCNEGAVTIAANKIIQHYTLVEGTGGRRVSEEKGLIELRWSPTCKTKWARATLHRAVSMNGITVEQAGGYKHRKDTNGHVGATAPGIYYTNMIYSPGVECYAYANGPRFESNSTHWE